MGEAKRRRERDPTFGRVPKRPGYRGLVICPPIEVDGSRLFIKSTNLHPQELRFALLFWDRLVWPSSRAIHIPSGPDEAFLESARILRRPDYTINGDAVQGLAKAQMLAFEDLERAEPGVWAIAQGENSLLWKEGFVSEGTGAVVELHRAIPIPQREVPLAEILEFKHRRRDELGVLRHQLESFVTNIEAADDRSVALKKRISEIDEACANLLRVGREWRFPVSVANVKTSFSLSPLKFLPAVAAGWKIAEPYGLTAASVAAGMAGAVSTLEVKGDFGLRSARAPASPYNYAYRIDKELR